MVLFYTEGTKYLIFRQYITSSFNGDVMNHQTRTTSAREELLILATIKAKLAKNIMKVEAIDIRKEIGFDKGQCMLLNLVL